MEFLDNLYTLWQTFIMGQYSTYQTDYYDEIFPTIIWLLVLGVGVPLIYYLIMNGKAFGSSSFGTLGVWTITFILTLVITGLWTGYIAINQTQQPEIDSFIIYLSVLNAVFVMIIYIIFSAIIKKFSVHATNTPF